jgi:hypothetical protein
MSEIQCVAASLDELARVLLLSLAGAPPMLIDDEVDAVSVARSIQVGSEAIASALIDAAGIIAQAMDDSAPAEFPIE